MMDIELLISRYVDGDLSSEEESEFHHMLSVSPEARDLFREHLTLRSVARDERILQRPSEGLRGDLFARLQAEEGMSAAVAQSVAGTAGAGALMSDLAVPPRHANGVVDMRPPIASEDDPEAEERRKRRRLIPILIPFLICAIAGGAWLTGGFGSWSQKTDAEAEFITAADVKTSARASTGPAERFASDRNDDDRSSVAADTISARSIDDLPAAPSEQPAFSYTEAEGSRGSGAVGSMRNEVTLSGSIGREGNNGGLGIRGGRSNEDDIRLLGESVASTDVGYSSALENNSVRPDSDHGTPVSENGWQSAYEPLEEAELSEPVTLRSFDGTARMSSTPVSTLNGGPDNSGRGRGGYSDLSEETVFGGTSPTSLSTERNSSELFADGDLQVEQDGQEDAEHFDLDGAYVLENRRGGGVPPGYGSNNGGGPANGSGGDGAGAPAFHALGMSDSLSNSSVRATATNSDSILNAMERTFAMLGISRDSIDRVGASVDSGESGAAKAMAYQGYGNSFNRNMEGLGFSEEADPARRSKSPYDAEGPKVLGETKEKSAPQSRAFGGGAVEVSTVSARRESSPLSLESDEERWAFFVGFEQSVGGNLSASEYEQPGFAAAALSTTGQGIMPEFIVRIGTEYGETHQLFGAFGAGSHGVRTFTREITTTYSGSQGSSVTTVARVEEKQLYEYWGALGYRYSVKLAERWIGGAEAMGGFGSSFYRAGIGFPVTYKLAKSFRLEVRPGIQYRKAYGSPEVVTTGSMNPSLPSNTYREQVEAPRDSEGLQAVAGIGLILLIR